MQSCMLYPWKRFVIATVVNRHVSSVVAAVVYSVTSVLFFFVLKPMMLRARGMIMKGVMQWQMHTWWK